MSVCLKIIIFLFCIAQFTFSFSAVFVQSEVEFAKYSEQKDLIVIASPGRSGSYILTEAVDYYASPRKVIKTHLYPPEHTFEGKILFIFSNPDKAAESVLHKTITNTLFGLWHFLHMESANHVWLNKIKDTTNQTESFNLLAYDALGCHKQLRYWLHICTRPSELSPFESQILAIKYENLWDWETLEAIKEFLGIENFELPEKKERGYSEEELDPREIEFRNLYNLGTPDTPIYTAYDKARALWESAPPFQFLMIRD